MKIFYNNYLKKLSRDLRSNSTVSEILLWNEIKSRKMMGYQFMRQKPVKNYIVDFYCSKLKLVIEIDGVSHYGKEKEDTKRQNELEQIGLKFLRFDDEEVKSKMEEVLAKIKNWITEYEKLNGQPPRPL